MIERLAVAASIAVRHAGAYTDLILSDVETASRLARRRLLTVAIIAGSSMLAVLLACGWVVAAVWDTAGRNWALGGLLGLFVLSAALASIVLRSINADAPTMLSRTAREWAKDRQLLEDILESERGTAS